MTIVGRDFIPRNRDRTAYSLSPERARCLIQDKQPGIAQQGAGQSDSLTFASGNEPTPLADDAVDEHYGESGASRNASTRWTRKMMRAVAPRRM